MESIPVGLWSSVVYLKDQYWGLYLYINDSPDSLNVDSNIYLYDAELFRHISTSQDSLFLEDDINKLTNWTDEWLIK